MYTIVVVSQTGILLTENLTKKTAVGERVAVHCKINVKNSFKFK